MKLAGYKGQRLNRKDKEMKLRNKKTGEVLRLGSFIVQNPNHINCGSITKYDSLAELNEEWEDYEEPKKHHYYIEPRGQVIELEFGDDIDELKEELSAIGNYFETKEEAEKTVEKLKAWKRLKDKGFEFRWIDKEVGAIKYAFFLKGKTEINRFDYEDLDLLFGGEDE